MFPTYNNEPPPDRYPMSLAVKAYEDLSPQEKDRADRDLHGTEEPMKETPEFLENKLADLDMELGRLNENIKKYYIKALQIEQELNQAGNEEYVRSRKFRLMFLRADMFDALPAAKRLTTHFKEKYDLFGEEKLARRIYHFDLSEEEKVALISGALTYTGTVDATGRPVACFCRSNSLRFPTTCLKRVGFYIVQTILEGSEAAQKKGFVVIGYNMGGAMPNPLVARRLLSVLRSGMNGLPCRISGIHNFYNDPHEHFIMNLILVVLPKYNRSRFVAQFIAEGEEFVHSTLRYGINPDDLPITHACDFNYEMIRNHWQRQMRIENQRI